MPKDLKKIVFLSEFDAINPQERSGVPWHIMQEAQRVGIPFQPVQATDKRSTFQRLNSRFQQWKFRYLFRRKKGWYDALFSLDYSKGLAQSLPVSLFSNADIIMSISPRVVAFFPAGPPLVLWIDNTFDTYAMYPGRQGICSQTYFEALQVEQLAFARATVVYTASKWLAQRLPFTHGLTPEKIRVLPRGANLQNPPAYAVVHAAINQKMDDGICRLLFVNSGNWLVGRKGGPLVVETFNYLRKYMQVSLTIIGDLPDAVRKSLEADGVQCIGKLFKNVENDGEQYINMLLESHFLFVPSMADGFGIVYAEAAACGLPSVAKSVMGVTEAVKNGVTGSLLGKDATAVEFAGLLQKLWQDKASYRQLCNSAYAYSHEHFNWGKNLCRIVQEMK